jgi:hypothetical protein
MVYIPRYLVGKNLSLLSIGAMYIGNDGSINPASDFSDLHTRGVFDTFEMNLNYGLTEIYPTDAQLKNNVSTVLDFDFTIGEIQGPGGYAKLISIGTAQSLYFGVEGQTYDPASGEYFNISVTGIYDTLRFGVVEGKNVAMATFKPCGVYPYFAMVSGNSGGGVNPGTSGGLNSGNVRTQPRVTSQHP